MQQEGLEASESVSLLQVALHSVTNMAFMGSRKASCMSMALPPLTLDQCLTLLEALISSRLFPLQTFTCQRYHIGVVPQQFVFHIVMTLFLITTLRYLITVYKVQLSKMCPVIRNGWIGFVISSGYLFFKIFFFLFCRLRILFSGQLQYIGCLET